jgi:hypothetical protein
MFLVSLGEFAAMDGYSTGNDKYFAWLMFFFATLSLLLLFMNMLIAVMNEPFTTVGENKALHKFQQQVSIIVDSIDVIDINTIFKDYRYIIVIRPEAIHVQQGENMKDFIIDKVREEVNEKHSLMEKKMDILKDLLEKNAMKEEQARKE